MQNNKIKKLRLNLIIQNFNLKFITGKKCMGDFLSRLGTGKYEKSIKDVVHTVGANSIQFCKDKLKQFQKETIQDKTLKLIYEYYFNEQTNITHNE